MSEVKTENTANKKIQVYNKMTDMTIKRTERLQDLLKKIARK